MKDKLYWITSFKSFIFSFFVVISLVLFLTIGRDSPSLYILTLAAFLLNLIIVVFGIYNAYIRPKYEHSPISKDQLETLALNLSNGKYDPFDFLPESNNIKTPQICREDNSLCKYLYEAVDMENPCLANKIGISNNALRANVLEFNTTQDAVQYYNECMRNYWSNKKRNKKSDEAFLKQKGYVELNTKKFSAFVTPVYFDATYFDVHRGDHTSRCYSVNIQYDNYVVCLCENSVFGKFVLPQMINGQSLFKNILMKNIN